MRTMRTTWDRFWDMIIKRGDNECWEWKGYKSNGYGQFRIGKERVLAHRFAWELKNGKIPADRVIIHTCDNPICCNPRHLNLGTQKDNVDDREGKKRGRIIGTSTKKTVREGNAKLKPYQVDEIMEKYRAGKTIKELFNEYKKKKWGIKSERSIRRIVKGQTFKG